MKDEQKVVQPKPDAPEVTTVPPGESGKTATNKPSGAKTVDEQLKEDNSGPLRGIPTPATNQG